MKTVSTADHNDTSDLFSAPEQKPAIDLKGSVFTLTVLRLQSNDMAAIEKELRERLAQGPRFFEDAPIVIDLEILKEQNLEIDLNQLSNLLRVLRLIPVGVRHGSPEHQKSALEAGLALMKGGAIKDLSIPAAPRPVQAAQPESKPAPKMAEVKAPEQKVSETTKIIYHPIRSGQQIYAKGGDLIVLAAVNAGAEIIADGNIHVYAPLRGRALAGVRGDQSARIFCHNMEAQLISVAGHYRVFEDKVPSDIRNKAVQIYLDNEQLKIDLLKLLC
jgi:septum site-determining protein MinC